MISLGEYVNNLNNCGIKTLESNGEYFWSTIGSKFVARSPTFNLAVPNKYEIKEILKVLRPVILTYNVSSESDANSYLYYANDSNYDIESLDKNGRRDARLARRNFEFRFVNWDFICENGFKAFSDTRARNGLTDGTRNNFRERMKLCANTKSYSALACFEIETDKLAGFLTILEVENWVEITSSFSDNDFLKLCPNNGLFDKALKYYLCEKKVKIVSYGTSSIQRESKKDTLHQFKARIGFNALPIKRVFIINPKYKLFFNPVSEFFVKILLKVKKGNVNLVKLEGLFDILKNRKSGE